MYDVNLLKTTRSQALTKDYCYHVALEQCARAEAAEAEAAALRSIMAEAVWTVSRLRDQMEQARAALRTIEDQAARAALVQDRSVIIIKQTCKIIADTARKALGGAA